MVPGMHESADDIIRRAMELGFALAGVCSAKPSAHDQHVRDWLKAGHHGEMRYLAENLDVRLDPRELVPGAKAVICVADRHAESAGSKLQEKLPGRLPGGRIARYAFGRDYHKSMKKRLHALADELREQYPGHTFRCTVDTAPILEREFAALAGLGWIGKHTLLIHPRYGSYFLLGTIVTTLELTTSEADGYPAPGVPPVDHCGTCTRCIEACPTQCISSSGPRSLDASRCISYLTLEHRSEIDPILHEAMGDWVAGCDVCQEVCPHNREREVELKLHPDHAPRPPAPAFNLLEVLDWDEHDRRWFLRGSALKRMKLHMLKRNALIVLSNALQRDDDPMIRNRIRSLAEDENEHELVRLTARQVLGRLSAGSV